MQYSQRAAVLASVPILSTLPQSTLERVAQSCVWRQHERGTQILDYRDSSTDVFFLLSGKARAIIYSQDGKAVVFADLKPGAIFGEIAAIDGKARSAGVEALEACTIASLSANRFEVLLRTEPAVAMAILRHIAADVRRLSERVFEFSTLAVRNRIHAELLRLAGETQQTGPEIVLSPAPSLSDIADRIATHREAVSRELSRLSSNGLLRREGGNLHITDLARLADLVQDARGD